MISDSKVLQPSHSVSTCTTALAERRFRSVQEQCGRGYVKHITLLQLDDDEAAKEEEAEALRLQRKEAEALRPEDFGQLSEPESEEEAEEEEEAGTLGAAAARVHPVPFIEADHIGVYL